ncbi:MAG TPA: hypothetical protein DEP51_06145 [Clostridiales bacterium]|nr:hypothetical protein [Clostridiales bacterium]
MHQLFLLFCGGTFFAIPYLGLSVGILPSLAIGAAAFGAGELVLYKKDKLEIKSLSLVETIKGARSKNRQIIGMINKIEDSELRQNIRDVSDTITKIIDTIEKEPKKSNKMNNFFEYYLPVTLNILTRYDEIENQKLSSEESKKFMSQTKNMMEKINNAFKNQLSNLYQSDIVDTDAEMKVFDSMLKADGYDTSNDFKQQQNK